MPQKSLMAARELWWFLLFVLIAQTALAGWNIIRSARNEARVTHTLRVLGAIDRFRATMIDAETAVRGYVIVGDPVFLEPYRQSLEVTPEAAAQIETLFSDNPEQAERFRGLQTVVQDRVGLLKSLIDQRDLAVRDHAAEVAMIARAKSLMDDIRVRLDTIVADEQSRLERRGDAAEQSLATSVLTTVVGGALSIAVLALSSWAMRREVAFRRQAQHELERTVADRTAELLRSVDDLNAEVAERERTTEELFKTAEELSRSNRELEQFAYVASHDLQEPLRKIQTFSDRLTSQAGDRLDAQSRDYLDRMVGSASRMRRLIDDLLAYSRLTTRPPAFAAVDLGLVMQEVLADLDDAVVRLNGHVEVGPLPTVWADHVQMRQVLQNLVANALKFHKPGEPPVVIIRGEVASPAEGNGEPPARTMAQFEVADRGIGFGDEYRDRIFQVFQRLHGRNEYEGTGIGLAVVRKIVERHGGTVTAHGEPGLGSRFVVQLPVAESASSQRLSAPAVSQAPE